MLVTEKHEVNINCFLKEKIAGIYLFCLCCLILTKFMLLFCRMHWQLEMLLILQFKGSYTTHLQLPYLLLVLLLLFLRLQHQSCFHLLLFQLLPFWGPSMMHLNQMSVLNGPQIWWSRHLFLVLHLPPLRWCLPFLHQCLLLLHFFHLEISSALMELLCFNHFLRPLLLLLSLLLLLLSQTIFLLLTEIKCGKHL